MRNSLRRAYLEALGLGGGWVMRRPAASAEKPGAARVGATHDPADGAAAPHAGASHGPADATAAAPRGSPLLAALAPAPAAAGWEPLQADVAACTRCALHSTRTQTVFGVGDPHADWLIVGEAPGAEEDRQGEPFVGRAGQLLNAMLRAIGLGRDQVYIANVLKCRPPGNRDPLGGEVAQCLPYLEGQIALLKPKIMLTVGRIATQNLLRTDQPLARLRRRVHAFGESRVPLVATYHPAYLLRTPADKRKAWEDLKFAREALSRV